MPSSPKASTYPKTAQWHVRGLALSSTLALAAVLAGCASTPTHDAPIVASAQRPSHVSHLGVVYPASNSVASVAADEALPALDLGWLRSHALRQIVELALAHNHDARVALANVQKARAQFGISSAAQLPTLNAQAQGNHSGGAERSTAHQYTAQLAVTSFELDLWGRVASLNAAAQHQFLQTQHAQHNVRITLAADVITAWLTLAAQQQRLHIARQVRASREKTLALTRTLFTHGGTSSTAVLQALSAVGSAEDEVLNYEAASQRALNALQNLVGTHIPAHLLPKAPVENQPPSEKEYPFYEGAGLLAATKISPQINPENTDNRPSVDWENPDHLHDDADLGPLAPIHPALRSTALLLRPDVQAAEQALRAQRANVSAARAALLPTITLSASAGAASAELNGLTGAGRGVWSFVPQIRWPIFDGGQARQNLNVAHENQNVAVAQYEKAIQTAFYEVANALNEQAQYTLRLANQNGQVFTAQKLLDKTQARFALGAESFLAVLDAQRSYYSARQTRITQALALRSARVTLWKALGGQDSASLAPEHHVPPEADIEP